MQKASTAERIAGLDVLRFAAIVLVLGRHLDLPDSSPAALAVWKTGGWVGVDVFLVLSGFAIFSVLSKEYQRTGNFDVRRFLARRWLRIYPPFLALIAFTLIWAKAHNRSPAFADIAGELLMLQNYAWLFFGGGSAGKLWIHTWTLAVIWHFYLVIGLLAFLAIRWGRFKRPFGWVPLAFGLSALLCLTLRIFTAWRFDGFNNTWFLFGTHVRLDSLMFGVFLAYSLRSGTLPEGFSRAPVSVLLLGGAICFVPAFIFPLEQHELLSVLGVILFYCGAGLLILGALRFRVASTGWIGVFAFLGAASYSIYLWHMAVEGGVKSLAQSTYGHNWLAAYVPTYLALAVIIGCLMHLLVEAPLGKLRGSIAKQ